VKRLRDADQILTAQGIAKLRQEAVKFRGDHTTLRSSGPIAVFIVPNLCGRSTIGDSASVSDGCKSCVTSTFRMPQ
jgi:hypothetical protein